jgi:hypothetical protein
MSEVNVPAGPAADSDGTDPVVVSLLRQGIKYAPEVVAQAVIELVRDGRLSVEQDEGAVAAVSLESGLEGGRQAPEALAARGEEDWRRPVLERLRSRALPDVPTPLSVLTTVDGGDFWSWRHAFETELLALAERDGLLARRFSPRETMAVVCGLTLCVAAGVGAVVAVLFRPSPGFGAGLAAALFGFIVLSVTLGRLADWRLSESGRRTVQQAEAAAALAATDAPPPPWESAVRAGVTPLPSDHIWSSFGGTWRVVGLGSRFGDTRRLPRQVREALPERRVLRCQVVKHWSVPGGRERDPAYCCAFDDGISSFTWTFAIPERTWHGLSVGDVVTLDFSPRRHRLFDVKPQPRTPPSPSSPSSPPSPPS